MVNMCAPEVSLQHGWVLELNLALQQLPDLLFVARMTSKLEIIDVDPENCSERGVSVATGPIHNVQKACLSQLPATILLPACAGIWVTIERKHERTYRVPHVRP